MSASTVAGAINNLVREVISPMGLVDNVFQGNPTWDWFWKGREVQDGGTGVEWAFNDTDNQQGQNIVQFNQYKVKPVPFGKRAALTWVDTVFPVALSLDRMRKISGSPAIIKYVKETIDRTLRSGLAQLSTELFGDGTDYDHPVFPGTTRTPIEGLANIIAADRTYAGHDSTSNTALDSYVKAIAPAGFSDMWTPSDDDFLTDAMTEVLTETDYQQGSSVDYIVTTRIMRDALLNGGYREGIFPVVYNQRGERLQLPAKGIDFQGIPVLHDRSCGAGRMYFLNSSVIQLVTLRGADMTYQEFEPNSGGDAVVANFILSCAIRCVEPRRCGVITGGSSTRTNA